MDSRPLVPLDGVVWRSCDITPGIGARLVHEAPGGPVAVELPADLETAVDKRRSEFLAGRLCAGLALRELGVSSEIARRGRAPVWPDGVRGSISHTSERAMAVVSRRVSALGLDCERLLAADAAAEIDPLVVSARERGRRPATWSEAMFCTVVFSAKEALYKAISDRLDDIPDFLEAEVETLDARALTLRLRGVRMRAGYALDAMHCVTLAWRD